MLTKKQKEFADEYLETGNGTQAALKAYDTTSENVAAHIASENVRKAKVQEYLEEKSERAAERIFELVNQDENLNVALGASKDVLDRAGLKPEEKVKHSGNVNVSFDEAFKEYDSTPSPETNSPVQ